MQGKLVGGRYRILDRLGEGGMATVYVAKDEKLNRKVAIKILHQHFSDNQDVRSRFAMEATAISAMDHPNILKVYDFSGPESKQLWIVTEVLKGQNLSHFARSYKNNCINPIISCFIVREILKALEHAHQTDIVHRDIKPENVMILKSGKVKLMDFGIAKNMHNSNKTMTGTFMGSPSYMSPEQVRGKNIDARSDIYSLGILFYEIVTGRLPYTGDTTHAVILRIMEGNYTAPHFLTKDLPEDIDRVICKAIDAKAGHRFQDTQSFAHQIDIFIQKIGFVESHVELERYASNPTAYMQQLVSMTHMSVRDGTIKTVHGKRTSMHNRSKRSAKQSSVAQFNQTSLLEPLPYNPSRTAMESKSIAAKRKDRMIPAKKPVKKATQSKSAVTRQTKHLQKTRHTKILNAKTQVLPQKGQSTAVHLRNSVSPRLPQKRRVRPAVPKRTRPVPRKIAQKKHISRNSLPPANSPFFGMMLILAMLGTLGYGFFKMVIEPFSPPSVSQRNASTRKMPPAPRRKPAATNRSRSTQEISVKIIPQKKSIEPRPSTKKTSTIRKDRTKKYRNPHKQSKNDRRSPHSTKNTAKRNKPTSQKDKNLKEVVNRRNNTPMQIEAPKKEELQKSQKKAVEEAKKVQAPVKPTLIISANTAAQIYIDGRPRGTTVDDTYHSRPIELKPGRHKIVLKHRSYEDLVVNKNLKAGEKVYLTGLKMKKKAIKVPLRVRVDSTPTKMTLKGKNNNTFINRNILNKSERLLLDPGMYSLTIEHKGKVIQREVNLREGSGGFTIDLKFSRK